MAADESPPADFGGSLQGQQARLPGGVPGPGNPLGCPPGTAPDMFGRCIPKPANPQGGNSGSPSWPVAGGSVTFNCGKGSDGSQYPNLLLSGMLAVDACNQWPGEFMGLFPTWSGPAGRTMANVPADPGYPQSCVLQWWAFFGEQFHSLTGSYEDYVTSWLNQDNCGLTTPKPQGTAGECGCDMPSDPTPPCSFCGQSSGSNSSCPVCNITVNTQPIADAIQKLLDKIENTQINCDQITSDCLEQIAHQVKAIIDEEGPTCEECCQKIADGVALTASEALVCASCECSNLENQCSPGLGAEDGSTCQGCGQSPCCCQGGECVPCDEQSPQTKFIGYYNCNTGETAVGKVGGVAFGPPWISLPPMADEASALTAAEEAVAYCPTQETPTQPPPSVPNPIPLNPGCDIFQFSSPAAAGQFMLGLAGGQAMLSMEAVTIQAAKSVFQIIGDELGSTLGAYELGQSLLGPISGSLALSPLVATMIGCGNQGTIQGLTALSALAVAGNLAGIDYTQFTPQIGYAIHAACRNRQLSPDGAMAAYLANQIDYNALDTHWGISGYCPNAVTWASNASRSKPAPIELIQLNNRGIISDQQFSDGMRQLGYTNTGDVDSLKQLGQILPPYSDIVRMMVRDAGDNSLVQRFGLDTDFTVKYSDQLKQWAKGQGVSDQIMQYLWRSHWSIPAPGQLFEMYHRLRKTGQFGNEAQVLSDVTTALEQQDILPFWIPRLLAISFRPLTRVDARRAFQIGALSEDGVYNSYIDQGYSDDNAQILTTFTKKLKSIGIRNEPAIKLWLKGYRNLETTVSTLQALGYSDSDISDGLSRATLGFADGPDAKALIAGEISAADFIAALVARGARQDDAAAVANILAPRINYSPVIAQYEAGLVTRDNAVSQMVNAGMSNGRANYFVNRIDGQLSVSAARACQIAVRRQFLTGGLSAQDATKALQGAGIVAERASTVVSRWQCELSARTRQPSVSMLCKWLSEGSISPDQFLARAKRLGFSPDDAVAILGDCNVRINTARLRQAVATAKADATAAAKAQRQAERQEAIALQQANQLVKARQQRAKAITRRSKTMYAAVDKVIGLNGMAVADAVNLVKGNLDYVQQQYSLTIDDGLEIVTRAVDAWDGIAETGLREAVDQLGQLYQAELTATGTPDDAYPFSTTG